MTTDPHLGASLSETQRELLQTAVEEGYLKVPREITLVELAEIHDISDIEASRQLRRGLDVITRDVLLEKPSE